MHQNIAIRYSTYQKLKSEACASDRTMSEVLDKAIDLFIEARLEGKIEESIKK